jgi:DNA-binding NtrC family response regulator
MGFRLLIVDDERIVRNSLSRSLRRRGWEIRAAAGVCEARETLRSDDFDLILADYRLGDGTGLEVLSDARELCPEAAVVMLTAHGNIQLAVEAMRGGAFDFLEKGCDPELMRLVVERALEQVRLRREVEALGTEGRVRSESMVAESAAMKEVLRAAREYASTDVTILLRGETGTGKSLIADYVHQHSDRAEGPFVTLNCGAIPSELLESELFGYDEGAFTGASQRGKTGLVERANGGTLFLDEIGDLHPDLQSKLLLVLESGQVQRVGSVEPRPIDVRFVAATNVDLEARVADRSFRQDLYYRLNVAPLTIPPLRERTADILPLAHRLLLGIEKKLNKRSLEITDAAERCLRGHPWPGNVRELRNVLERAALLSRSGVLGVDDLNLCVNGSADDPFEVRLRLGGEAGNLLHRATDHLVARAWEASGHNQSRAAKLLGVPRTTLQHHLRKLGLA